MCSVPPGPSPAAPSHKRHERDLGHAVGQGRVEHPAVAAVVLVHALGRRAQLVVHDQDRPRLGRDLGEARAPSGGRGRRRSPNRAGSDAGAGRGAARPACRARGRLPRTGGRRRRRRRRCRDRPSPAPILSSAAAISVAAASALAAGKRAGFVPPGPRTLGSSIMWPLNRTTLAGSAGALAAPLAAEQAVELLLGALDDRRAPCATSSGRRPSSRSSARVWREESSAKRSRWS